MQGVLMRGHASEAHLHAGQELFQHLGLNSNLFLQLSDGRHQRADWDWESCHSLEPLCGSVALYRLSLVVDGLLHNLPAAAQIRQSTTNGQKASGIATVERRKGGIEHTTSSTLCMTLVTKYFITKLGLARQAPSTAAIKPLQCM